MAALARKSDHSARRYTDHLKLRVQPALSIAIDAAAAKQLTTPSEYVRRCLIDRLRNDGVDPSALAGAA